MWLDGFVWDKSKARLSEWRMRETVAARPVEDFLSVISVLAAKRSKAKPEAPGPKFILAVACPYEKPRFSDAAKTIDEAKHIEVMDIAELLAQSME
jgi:hypothetical protein